MTTSDTVTSAIASISIIMASAAATNGKMGLQQGLLVRKFRVRTASKRALVLRACTSPRLKLRILRTAESDVRKPLLSMLLLGLLSVS